MDILLIVIGLLLIIFGMWAKSLQFKHKLIEKEENVYDYLIKQQQKLDELGQNIKKLQKARTINLSEKEKMPQQKFPVVLSPSTKLESKDSSLPTKYEQVLEMSEQGDDVETIAKKINLGIRETKIILKFYQKKEVIEQQDRLGV